MTPNVGQRPCSSHVRRIELRYGCGRTRATSLTHPSKEGHPDHTCTAVRGPQHLVRACGIRKQERDAPPLLAADMRHPGLSILSLTGPPATELEDGVGAAPLEGPADLAAIEPQAVHRFLDCADGHPTLRIGTGVPPCGARLETSLRTNSSQRFVSMRSSVRHRVTHASPRRANEGRVRRQSSQASCMIAAPRSPRRQRNLALAAQGPLVESAVGRPPPCNEVRLVAPRWRDKGSSKFRASDHPKPTANRLHNVVTGLPLHCRFTWVARGCVVGLPSDRNFPTF